MIEKVSSKKILSLPKYGYSGPSSRYRFYNYQECFENNGYDVTIRSFFNDKYFIKKSKIKNILNVMHAYLSRINLIISLVLMPKRYDIILVEYELVPYFPSFLEYMLYKRGYEYIVDYDDPLFHRYDMHHSKWVKILLQNKIARVMAYARYVIVGNDYLKNYAQKHNKNIMLLPTVVKHLDNYRNKVKEDELAEGSAKINIGWIGSKSTSKHILTIVDVMEAIAKKYSVKFTLIGFDETLLTEQQKLQCHINIVPWTEEHEIKEIANMDIGIMPLEDNPWTRGKCGFKLIQYMSCGKPVIASPIGINTKIVSPENGFLVEETEEWYSAFEMLILDKELRDTLGNEGFNKMKKRYNYTLNCKKYIHLIESIIG